MSALISRRGVLLAAPALIIPRRRSLAQIGPGPLMVPTFVPYKFINVSFLSSNAGQNVSSLSMSSFGTAYHNRWLVAAFWSSQTNAFSTVTIGGVSATQAVTQGSTGGSGGAQFAALWIANVPTGTSGTVSWTPSPNGVTGCCLFGLTGIGSATPTATAGGNAATFSGSIAVPAGYALIGAGGVFGSVSSPWSSMLVNNQGVTGGILTTGLAGIGNAQNFSYSVSVTTGSPGSEAFIIAAWGP